jgi:excisionase family DNA binding protein
MTSEDLRAFLQKIEQLVSRPAQRYLSIKDAAAYTGLSTDWIRDHIKVHRTLPAANVGTLDRPVYRLDREDLDAFMQRLKAGPADRTAARSEQEVPFSPHRRPSKQAFGQAA